MAKHLPRPLQLLLFYLMLVWLGSMLLTGNLLVLPLIGAPRCLREPLVRLGISHICRTFLSGCEKLGLMELDLDSLETLDFSRRVLLVPNHPSMIDAFLILSRVRFATCLMKASLGSNLFLGVGARLAGYVPNRCPARMFKSAIARVRPYAPLLIFPEGTRSTRQPVNPMQGAAALIAQRADAVLQTILITTNSPYLCKGWKIWQPPRFPIRYRAVPGPVLQADDSIENCTARLQQCFETRIARSIDPDMPR